MKELFKEQLDELGKKEYLPIEQMYLKEKTVDYFGDVVEPGDVYVYFWLLQETTQSEIMSEEARELFQDPLSEEEAKRPALKVTMLRVFERNIDKLRSLHLITEGKFPKFTDNEKLIGMK